MSQLSIHIRGPTWLHQMAVYIPATTSHEKRHGSKAAVGGHPHGHHHLHNHDRDIHNQPQRDEHNKRAVGDLVIATIDGQQVSWINSYSGPPAPTPESFPTPIWADEVVFETVVATTFVTLSAPCPTTSKNLASQKSTLSTSNTAAAIPSSADNDAHPSTGSWTRRAYYNAASGYSKGFTFLNHHGETNGAFGTIDGAE